MVEQDFQETFEFPKFATILEYSFHLED